MPGLEGWTPLFPRAWDPKAIFMETQILLSGPRLTPGDNRGKRSEATGRLQYSVFVSSALLARSLCLCAPGTLHIRKLGPIWAFSFTPFRKGITTPQAHLLTLFSLRQSLSKVARFRVDDVPFPDGRLKG